MGADGLAAAYLNAINGLHHQLILMRAVIRPYDTAMAVKEKAGHWGLQRRAGLDRFFARVVVLPYSSRVATIWGEIQAHAQLRGRPRPVNDSLRAFACRSSAVRERAASACSFSHMHRPDSASISGQGGQTGSAHSYSARTTDIDPQRAVAPVAATDEGARSPGCRSA